jgi:hypothetical protein
LNERLSLTDGYQRVPVVAGYSHSIVAGGLLETS